MEVIISTNICQFRCRLNIGFYFSPAPWTQQNKEVLWLQTVAAHWSVKCHNKGSCCIQGPVEKLSWLHSSNFITKQRIYLPVRVNSLFSAGIFKKYLINISGRSFNFRGLLFWQWLFGLPVHISVLKFILCQSSDNKSWIKIESDVIFSEDLT